MQQQLLTVKQVASLIGVSRPTVYRWLRTLDFPRPLRVGQRASRWRRHEVERWLEDRPRTE